MASTYSPNLRIELIATGEQSNTWGGTTNNNLGTLIEQAISGVVSIDISAGNVTLTALQGAEDQSRQMVIIATGTAGVTRTITAPAVNKVYSVVNNSNTTVSFIASGGTGVTLIAGAKKYVYCDGTNFYDAINAVTVTSGTIDGTTIGATTPTTGKFTTVQSTVDTGTAPFTVASTTPVANLTASNVTTNANLTGAVTSVGNATSLGSFTSANLAAALTDETGTGANVFATSPTLVTPALGTPSALVGTNITGTASGLSIGGNAATVTTNANLSGAISSIGNSTSLGSFTSGQLALALSDETGTGKAVFSVNPSITSATLVTPILGTPQSGNFSTGTFTWPTFNQNTTGSSGSCTGNAATVTNGITTTNYNSYSPTLTGGNASGTWGINVTGSSGSCTGNAATVSNGIYTTNYNLYSPTLTGGGASGTWGINVTGNAGSVTNGVYNNGGTYSINVTGTATNQSGGTVNATTITGSSDATINGVRVGRGPGNQVANTVVGYGTLSSNTVGNYNTAVGRYSLYTNGTGAYNTAVGDGANSANGDGSNNTTIGYGVQTSTTGSSNEIVIGSSTQGFGAFYITMGNPSNYIYNHYNTSATWTRVSDERLKTNIQPAGIGLGFINRLNVKTYNWRPSYDIPKELNSYSEENTQDTDTVMHGMLAQEVKEALDAENIEHFAGWDVNPKDGTQAISLELFILPLINSIKELTARLEALEGKSN